MLPDSAQSTGGIADSPATFPILAVILALTIYILWRRYRSRRRLLERVAELEFLSDAGRSVVSAELDVGALCRLFGQQVGEIISADSLQVILLRNDMAFVHYWVLGSESQMPPDPLPAYNLDQFYLKLWNNGQSAIIHDDAKASLRPIGLAKDGEEKGYRSAAAVPLISGAQVIGFFAALNLLPNRYSERELSQLTILSNQTAAAISNARTYQKVRDRSAQLELVGHIARQITAINDIDELLQQVVDLTCETFGFASVNIFGIDPISNEAFNQASSLQGLQPNTLRLEPGRGLIGTVLNERTTILSNNTIEDERFLGIDISVDTKSEIVIPLFIDQELLGVLDVQSGDPSTFSNEDKRVLEALADQIAVAINKARQFTAQRERAWIATAQLQVADTISKSEDLDDLANSVARLPSILVGAQGAVLYTWDEELDEYNLVSYYGFGERRDGQFDVSSISLGSWPSLDAVHVAQEALVTDQPLFGQEIFSDFNEAAANKAGAVNKSENWLLPLVTKGQTIGLLAAAFPALSEATNLKPRREILRNLASQTAQGIDALKLQEALQEEAWVNAALLQVAEAVNRLTDLDEILSTIVRLVPMLVGVKNSVVLIWDDERERYRAGPSHGIGEMAYGTLESFEIDLKEFPLLEKQELERAGPDSAYYTFQLPDWMSTVIGSSTAGIFPLRARGSLVGVLLVGPTRRGRPLTGRRLNIVIGIAQQAAIAVVNDHLYKESAERNRMDQELDMAFAIQSSLLPAEDPDIPGITVAGYWQAARQVSGDFYDFLDLNDGRWGIAIADVADKGIPAALFMALSRTILRTVAFNRRNPAEVLHRSNQIIYGDTTSDHFVTVFYAVWDPSAQLLHYASGGHNPPLLIRSDGSTQLLSSEGVALGVIEDVSYGEKSVQINRGDVVVFYTDGVTEAVNEDFDEFGLERLLQVVRTSHEGGAERIIESITKAIADHAGSTSQFDDITIVVMKR